MVPILHKWPIVGINVRKTFVLEAAMAAPTAAKFFTAKITGYKHFTEICSGSEAGSHLRLIDFGITQL